VKKSKRIGKIKNGIKSKKIISLVEVTLQQVTFALQFKMLPLRYILNVKR